MKKISLGLVSALLFSGAGTALYPEAQATGNTGGIVTVESFEKLGSARVFTDHGENPDSKTLVYTSLVKGVEGKAVRIHFDVPADKNLNYAYGGAAIDLRGKPLSNYRGLSFWIRRASGTMGPFRLQLTSLNGGTTRQGIFIQLNDLDGEWRQVKIAVNRYNAFDAAQLNDPNDMGFVLMGGKGAIDIDEFRYETVEPENEQREYALPTNRVKMTRGYAVWSYQDMKTNAAAITAHNARAGRNEQIRYAYPWAGEIRFKDGKVHLRSEFQGALALADRLKGQDVQVLPMLDGISAGSEKVDADEWDRAGKRIARAMEADERIAGIHLDIEPHSDALHALFVAIKRHSDKPVTAAVGAFDDETFRCVDQLTLMGYDLGETPDTFERRARTLYKNFMDSARRTQTPALIGVPAIATHFEYETIKRNGKERLEATGFTMLEYMKRSLDAVRGATGENDPVFLGLSIWALHPKVGLQGPGDKHRYYPTTIDTRIWELLATPIH